MKRGGLAADWTRRLGGIAFAYALALAAILSPLAALDAMARSSDHGLCLSAGSSGSDDPGPADPAVCACPGLCQGFATLAAPAAAPSLRLAWTRTPAARPSPLPALSSRLAPFFARGPPQVMS